MMNIGGASRGTAPGRGVNGRYAGYYHRLDRRQHHRDQREILAHWLDMFWLLCIRRVPFGRM